MWTIKTNCIPIRPQSILVSWEKGLALGSLEPMREDSDSVWKGPGVNSFGLQGGQAETQRSRRRGSYVRERQEPLMSGSHQWCPCWQSLLFFCSFECGASLSWINSACIRPGNRKCVLHVQGLFTCKEMESQMLNFFGLCLVKLVMDGYSLMKMMWRGECKMRIQTLQSCFLSPVGWLLGQVSSSCLCWLVPFSQVEAETDRSPGFLALTLEVSLMPYHPYISKYQPSLQ